jgi:ABC-type lipoprotein release transport system permease subunit
MLAGWLRQVLFAVQPSNPAAIAAALLVIVVAAVLATAPPIWRAVRIDPASALRHE